MQTQLISLTQQVTTLTTASRGVLAVLTLGLERPGGRAGVAPARAGVCAGRRDAPGCGKRCLAAVRSLGTAQGMAPNPLSYT
jgi:hypothetical protein